MSMTNFLTRVSQHDYVKKEMRNAVREFVNTASYHHISEDGAEYAFLRQRDQTWLFGKSRSYTSVNRKYHLSSETRDVYSNNICPDQPEFGSLIVEWDNRISLNNLLRSAFGVRGCELYNSAMDIRDLAEILASKQLLELKPESFWEDFLKDNALRRELDDALPEFDIGNLLLCKNHLKESGVEFFVHHNRICGMKEDTFLIGGEDGPTYAIQGNDINNLDVIICGCPMTLSEFDEAYKLAQQDVLSRRFRMEHGIVTHYNDAVAYTFERTINQMANEMQRIKEREVGTELSTSPSLDF